MLRRASSGFPPPPRPNRHGLQRIVFVSLVGAVTVTAIVVALVYHLRVVSRTGNQFAGAKAFLGSQFARVWDRPELRQSLATELANDFGLHVELLDASRGRLGGVGGICRHAVLDVLVQDESGPKGYVRACPSHRRAAPMWLPVLAAVLVLWAGSGVIARRLARPLWELARVAADIGRGRLSSRVAIPGRTYREAEVVVHVLNDMAARIETQVDNQRAMLAAVSHELRTPLARMRLLIEMARTQVEGHPESVRRRLDELDFEAEGVDRLVGDLLASSRIDFAALQRTRLEAVAIAREALERASVDLTRLAPSQVEISFEADATLMSRALANLIENAERHGGGLEAMRIESRPGGVAFIAEDKGDGFQPGDEARVFEPFFKRGDTGSVGLGLALVRRIAEAHGGRAYAENRPGGGARVAIEVALRPSAEPSAPPRARSRDRSGQS